MRIADQWKDYEIIDTSGGEKLERWGDVLLIPPGSSDHLEYAENSIPAWKKADARYIRSNAGGGSWQNRTLDRKAWKIRYGGLTFKVSPTGFKHTGTVSGAGGKLGSLTEKLIRDAPNRPVKVLNLFAYTGGATLACAAGGRSVSAMWTPPRGWWHGPGKTPQLSGLSDKPIRWIVDDCKKFVAEGAFAAETAMTVLSWIRRPMGEGPAARSGSWRSRFMSFGGFVPQQAVSDDALFFLLNCYTRRDCRPR